MTNSVVIGDCETFTAGMFIEPIENWCDGVKEFGLPREYAFTSLTLFFGHILGGAAEELGLHPNVTEVGKMIAEALAEELARAKT